MKQVFTCGKFYGVNRCQVETSAFVFNEVEDFVNNQVPLHTHENAHFLFVISGGYEAVIKDKKISCKSPTVIYYPAGTTHDDHFHTGDGKFLTVSLTSVENENLFEQMSFIDYSVDFEDFEISSLGKRIRKELYFPDSLSSVILEGMATELLAYASRNLNKSDKVPDWLKSAYELINDCYNESIKITEIAAAVGVHPIYLASTFRKFFNCSPGEYLRKCRIELASNLLLEQKKSLVEIALMSGFADQSQFTRSFKQYTGLTPAKFRKLHKS